MKRIDGLKIGAGLGLLLATAAAGRGQTADPATQPSPNQMQAASPTGTGPGTFKKMSLDQLLDIQVTSVSREPEKLSDAASAIQVITNEDIQRSGAMTLPQALQLAPNLQVGEVNAHDWAISSRGFNGVPLANNSLSDKLLVMIDGRTVYSPLFGGVFWDVQNVMLEDVDRVEVVSGPGGTLWGANAVNGVINVVSKDAKDTQGLYLSNAEGSFLQDSSVVRYGGSNGSNLFYRVYGERFDYDSTALANGSSAGDRWNMNQGGFRMDYYPSTENTLTLQGDIYSGSEGDPTTANIQGGNLLGRWTHVFSPDSDLSAQMYFDDTGRQSPPTVFDDADSLKTYDFDFQHRFPIEESQSIIWGLGYRFMQDRYDNTPQISFFPSLKNMQLFSGFVQDEIKLVPDRLKLTVGTKLEHNVFSGFELEPSVRLAWTPTARQTIWGAVSRAVRTPSRLDTEESTPDLATPNEQFDSEKLIAYELGYRVRPLDPLSLSLASFYNDYQDLRSINFNPSAPPLLIFANDQKGQTWGLEASADFQATSWWKLRGGYTYLNKKLSSTNPAVVPESDAFEGDDPYNQWMIQSILDLPDHWQFDVVARYVDSLPSPAVAAYYAVDIRLAWQYENVEVAIVGQNLLKSEHVEFGASQIPRSVFGKVTFRW